MQISPIASVKTSPVGVTNVGTMRVGHALNGISYTEHQLVTPGSKPVATFTGSLEDAIAGAKALATDLETRGLGRVAFALTGLGNQWSAQALFADPTVIRAIDNGPGHGGIASITFPSVSRSLGALVTASGSLVPSSLR